MRSVTRPADPDSKQLPGPVGCLWPAAWELRECHTAAVARLPGPSPLGGPPNASRQQRAMDWRTPLRPSPFRYGTQRGDDGSLIIKLSRKTKTAQAPETEVI